MPCRSPMRPIASNWRYRAAYCSRLRGEVSFSLADKYRTTHPAQETGLLLRFVETTAIKGHIHPVRDCLQAVAIQVPPALVRRRQFVQRLAQLDPLETRFGHFRPDQIGTQLRSGLVSIDAITPGRIADMH